MKNIYQKNSHSKFLLQYHLVLVCKYRKKLLTSELKDYMKDLLNKISFKLGFKILIMESDIDHLHLLISCKPNINLSNLIKKIKQITTVNVWKKFNLVLKKHFWNEKTFWTDGYFVCSVGEASSETIKQYILHQG